MVETLPEPKLHPAMQELELRRQRLADISARAALAAIACRTQREQFIAKQASATSSARCDPASPRHRAMPSTVLAAGRDTRAEVVPLNLLGALPDTRQASVLEKMALWRARVEADAAQASTIVSVRSSRDVAPPVGPRRVVEEQSSHPSDAVLLDPAALRTVDVSLVQTAMDGRAANSNPLRGGPLVGPPSASDESCFRSRESDKKDLLATVLERLERMERQLEEERASTRSMVATYERRLREGDEVHRRDVERLSSLIAVAVNRRQGSSVGSGTTTLPSTGNSEASGDER